MQKLYPDFGRIEAPSARHVNKRNFRLWHIESRCTQNELLFGVDLEFSSKISKKSQLKIEEKEDIGNIWFQQDGATCHTRLKKLFGGPFTTRSQPILEDLDINILSADINPNSNIPDYLPLVDSRRPFIKVTDILYAILLDSFLFRQETIPCHSRVVCMTFHSKHLSWTTSPTMSSSTL